VSCGPFELAFVIEIIPSVRDSIQRVLGIRILIWTENLCETRNGIHFIVNLNNILLLRYGLSGRPSLLLKFRPVLTALAPSASQTPTFRFANDSSTGGN
jgi:hypothetical protein